MGIKKAMAAVMTFGAVVFGSTAASAYTPQSHCHTVVQERLVEAPGRRDRVVMTTARTCEAPRRAVTTRPVRRVVEPHRKVANRKASKRKAVRRRGKVVARPAVEVVRKPTVKKKVVVREAVVKKSPRSRGAVVTKTTTTRTSSKRASERRRR